MKLISYNLFEGAVASYPQLVEFVSAEQPDVLCLQEINTWQNRGLSRLKDFAVRCGFSTYVYGDSNSKYKLSTFTRLPVTRQLVHREGFWHAAVEIGVETDAGKFTIFNLHLNPLAENQRSAEIEQLLSLTNLSRPTIIAGDLNSLSRRDNYPTDMLSRLEHKGIVKFGANYLQYDVTDRLTAAGLTDLAAAHGNLATTVPTLYNRDRDHEIPLRIDYVFATGGIAAQTTRSEVIKTALTDSISDHYPVVIQ